VRYLTDSGSGSTHAFRKDFGGQLTDFGSGLWGLAHGFRREPVYRSGFFVEGFFWDLGGGLGFGGVFSHAERVGVFVDLDFLPDSWGGVDFLLCGVGRTSC
jgi:hypothetical protein